MTKLKKYPYNLLSELTTGGNFISDLGEDELLVSLEFIINTLKSAEQEFIRLHYIQGLKTAIIGKMFNCAESRVREINQKVILKLRHPSRFKHLMMRKNDE